jgi:hypothetical protein
MGSEALGTRREMRAAFLNKELGMKKHEGPHRGGPFVLALTVKI